MSGQEQILTAAFTLFLAHGYDGTSLADIVHASGLSKGAFYHHFKSKQALFEEVIARFFPSPFATFDWSAHERLSADGQRQAIEALYAEIIAASAAMGGDMVRYFALFFESLSRLATFRAGAHDVYSRLIAALAAAIEVESGASGGICRATARRFIAEQEGELYLWAVTGQPPARRQPINDKG
ncbi:MAG: helix-turn-helix domain-containing protein [Devosia sp.]